MNLKHASVYGPQYNWKLNSLNAEQERWGQQPAFKMIIPFTDWQNDLRLISGIDHKFSSLTVI